MVLLDLPNELLHYIAGFIDDNLDLISFTLAHPSLHWLLKTKPYRQAVFDKGWTLLHWAAAYNRVAIAKAGLTLGQDVNAVNSKGQSALWLAADKGAVGVASLLLALEGVNVDLEARCGWNMWNALFQACWKKRDKVVELFISSGRFDPNAKCSSGWTPLHKSVHDLRKKSVRALLKSGKVDVNKRGLRGESPWEAACWHFSNEIGNMLIDAGLDVTEVNPQTGKTVLHLVARSEMLDCMLRILEMGLLDVNARDNNRATPLHAASTTLMNERGRAEVIKALLDAGCDPNARNIRNLTPLDYCILRRSVHGARALGWNEKSESSETGEQVLLGCFFTSPNDRFEVLSVPF
jgi:ankyrin repeat protein